MNRPAKYAFVALLASVLLTTLLYYLSYVLLPGFFLSAFVTVKDHTAFRMHGV